LAPAPAKKFPLHRLRLRNTVRTDRKIKKICKWQTEKKLKETKAENLRTREKYVRMSKEFQLVLVYPNSCSLSGIRNHFF
jgi:hypothetical protein